MPDTTAPAFPLFICGLPRAGTSFLFSVLSRHPAFANESHKDKELRYYEKLLGNRPWGQVDGVSQKKFAPIDSLIMPELVRTLDARLRSLRGGPAGHYINANPRDMFCSRIILDVVPEAKFVVALRDPLTHIWSALNYPSHSWGKREQSGFFREEDVRRTAEHWCKVASFLLRHDLSAKTESFFVLEQETLAGATPVLHRALESFIGIPGIAALMDEFADVIIHSSFIDDHGKGRDRRFVDRQQKLAHFADCQAMFAEDQRYASLVLEICGDYLGQLAALGLMQSGPSWRLLRSHQPLAPVAGSTENSLSGELYRRTVSFLLAHTARSVPGRIIVAGFAERSGADPLFAYLDGSDLDASILCSPVQLDGLRLRFADRRGVELLAHPGSPGVDELDAQQIASRVAELAASGGLDVLQIDDPVLAVDIAMRIDLVGNRPRLVLLPFIEPGSGDLARMRNVFANLGYAGAHIGTAFVAVRRDAIDTAMESELARLDT